MRDTIVKQSKLLGEKLGLELEGNLTQNFKAIASEELGMEIEGKNLTEVVKNYVNNFQPALKLIVEPNTSDDDLFGKVAADLQEDLVIEGNEISGKLLHVTDYVGFSSKVEEQEGHYITLKAVANEENAKITVQVVNGTPAAQLDEDGLCVLRILSNQNQIKYVVSNNEIARTYIFNLTNIELAE